MQERFSALHPWRSHTLSELTYIKGKDSDLESSIETMSQKLNALGFEIKEASNINPVPNVYSVHIRDKECELMFTNGKGATNKASLASALGEYFERLSCNYFFADFYLGEDFTKGEFVHYPNEKWFSVHGSVVPDGLLDERLWEFYDPEKSIEPKHLYDTNSGTGERGICALPYTRLRDTQKIWFPVSVIGNIYVSNGMSGLVEEVVLVRLDALGELLKKSVRVEVLDYL